MDVLPSFSLTSVRSSAFPEPNPGETPSLVSPLSLSLSRLSGTSLQGLSFVSGVGFPQSEHYYSVMVQKPRVTYRPCLRSRNVLGRVNLGWYVYRCVNCRG